ncbi:His-Xaa-Ser system radical SAM maturase HxsC [Pendulispora albinea]|uniref:His-Xaa-Ser system radical SAM maturase HxsC n=1 Tax=Pendulispora albinea TaxID=2741071 RepID=A0ABZ2M533_9BACT
MLLELSGRHLQSLSVPSEGPFIGRICEDPHAPEAARDREILLLREASDTLPEGFRAYLLGGAGSYEGGGSNRRGGGASAGGAPRDMYRLGAAMRYLAHGDVVRIDPRRGAIAALYRRSSPSNSLLVTERCDNYCVMCSQPPKTHDDAWLLDELRAVVPLMAPETKELGITGGEPALLGDGLIELVRLLEQHLPRTAVHILSNGRRFSDLAFARSLGRVGHPDLMVGIPIYSDLPEEHDYVVQARGAFSQTLRGILNLKRCRVSVEIRFVVHAETYRRLPELAHFLTRNLLFADHVAIMGLELTGFARANLDTLWVDPLDYREQLGEAVHHLHRAGMNVSIYNLPLCVLDTSLHGFARKSISDWKHTYFDVCDTCSAKTACGGFFASSSLRRSRGIRPISLP